MMTMMFQSSSQFFSIPISLSRKISVSRWSSFLLLLLLETSLAPSPPLSLSLSLSLSTRVSQTKRVSRRKKEVYLLETKRGTRQKERKKELSFVSFLGFQNPNYCFLFRTRFSWKGKEKKKKNSSKILSLSLSSSLSAAAATTTGHERGVIKEL